jgi:pseudaminic acid biosynthesis-associated methylase
MESKSIKPQNTDLLTEQEKFWVQEFGDEYTQRNQGKKSVASNTFLLSKIFSHTQSINSLIEFGANRGLNLIAIKQLLPDIQLSAIEINHVAVQELKKINENLEIFHQSILEFKPKKTWNFVLIKGVLIHINPDYLDRVYDLLYQSSDRYICLAEYYNPTPVEILYRGHQGKLFKRDFTGEMLDRFQDLKLIDYGFVYHRDNQFPQDDTNWFLLEKTSR